MATASKNLKGFFRQKKNSVPSGGISKSKSSSKRKLSAKHAAAFVSVDVQVDHDSREELLRQFDMNMVYGPCLGMSRLARWERAKCLGMNPPTELERLLKGEKVQQECLWDGRV